MSYKLLLLAAVGILITVTRFIISRKNSASHKSSILKLRRNPRLAESYSASLEIPYGKKEVQDVSIFRSTVEKISGLNKLGDFKISYYQLISENQLLIMTTLEYVAFDTGIGGTPTEIQKTNFNNFLLSFYPNKREMTVHSELYSNTDEKFQKEDFTKRIFNLSLS